MPRFADWVLLCSFPQGGGEVASLLRPLGRWLPETSPPPSQGASLPLSLASSLPGLFPPALEMLLPPHRDPLLASGHQPGRVAQLAH